MKKIEPKLTVEIIPSKSWYNNVRSNVSEKKWDIIRKKCYKEAGYKCEICGDNGLNQGQQHRVECHEIWNYDNKTKIQKLVGFISLCPLCHKVKHFGLAQISGDGEIAFHQLMKIPILVSFLLRVLNNRNHLQTKPTDRFLLTL